MHRIEEKKDLVSAENTLSPMVCMEVFFFLGYIAFVLLKVWKGFKK